MIKFLAASLSKIADSLPQINLVTSLYPTKTMVRAVAELYAYIIRFFLRVDSWYKENKFSHVLHSFTRPVELRYTDIIEKVISCAQTVRSLASAGAQSEQRDIHLELQENLQEPEMLRCCDFGNTANDDQ